MSYSAKRHKRMLAGVLAAAMALTVTPILGFTGTAGAAHLETADPIGEGNVCEGAPEEDPFTDVGDNDPAVDEIRCMVNAEPAITQGKTATTYEPNSFVQRRQMALFLQRVADLAEEHETSEDAVQELPADDGESAFTDIGDETADHQQAIRRLEDSGITEGVTATEFRPGENVTRRQMAKFLVRLQTFLAGEDFAPEPVNDCDDCFNDDDGDSGEDELNVLAREGVFIGTGGEEDQHNVSPGDDITRRQMAFVLTRKLEVLHDAGLITQLFDTEGPTNQTFTVTPDDTTVGESEEVDFTANVGDAEEVEIALVDCDNVDTDEDGNVTFEEDGTTGTADFGTVNADITEVNGTVVVPSQQETATPDAEGDVDFTVQTSGEECFVAVVWEDTDEDGELDLNDDGTPSEPFGISGDITAADVDDLVLTQDDDLNPFGENHTVTAHLVTDTANAEAPAGFEPAPHEGEAVVFQLFRDGTDGGGDTCTGGTVVDSETVLTDENGQADYTFTRQDPNEATGDTANDCVQAFHDEDGDGVLDGTENSDAIEKDWTDAPAEATTLDAEPETATNLVGTNHTVTATVEDQFGNPIEGETVQFEVDRAGDTASSFVTTRTTNSEGVATLVYEGPATADTDTILACADAGLTDGTCEAEIDSDLSDEVTKSWVEDEPGAPTFETAVAGTGDDFVVVTYDELIDCATVDANASNYEVFTDDGDGETARTEVSAACVDPSSGADDEVIITIAGDVLEVDDTVRVEAVTGDDGNTVLDMAGIAQPVGDDVTATVA